MITKQNCDCLLGAAFILNPEEGSAWIKSLILRSEVNEVDDKSDWIWTFAHCPKCGSTIPENTGKKNVG